MTTGTQLRIGIAGSTANTLRCVEALSVDQRFEICMVLTPEPKPIGRKQVVTQNPLHQWAVDAGIPVVLVGKRIDERVKAELQAAAATLDLLLVVDFGYLVPDWLLALPKIAPLNIHPSLLPRWRGSSPGQFVLLSGERESGVTLMRMTAGLDEGPVIAQPLLKVGTDWTQREYYQAAFTLITLTLADDIAAYAQSVHMGSPREVAQPAQSPTIVARRLNKDDGFVAWELLSKLMSGGYDFSSGGMSLLLWESFEGTEMTPPALAQLVERAARALSPWPGLWTLVPTSKGEKRMKILQCQVDSDRLELLNVQIEGQQIARFDEVKNAIL